MTARLKSKTLNIVDLAPALGAPAVSKDNSLAASTDGIAKDSAVSKKPAQKVLTAKQKLNDRLLPDAELQVDRVQGMDADVQYAAGAVNTPKVPIRLMNMHIMLAKGILTIDPLSFVLEQGKFAGTVRIDASSKVPDCGYARGKCRFKPVQVCGNEDTASHRLTDRPRKANW
jgi:uncharacterized protein involved in outer membrane biogenesis